jgi:hypothetical protein
MNKEQNRVEFFQDILAARVAQMIAVRENSTPTQALHMLMNTHTYGLLLDLESYLHFESAEYILYLYDAERRGDWELWIKS